MPGGWIQVESKQNKRDPEKRKSAKREASVETTTSAFAQLDLVKQQQEETRRREREEEAALRKQRQAEIERQRAEEAERNRRRDLAERQRRAKDPRTWPPVHQVLAESADEMLEELEGLKDDEVANTSQMMLLQYVFGTIDKSCRHSIVKRPREDDLYFQPLASVMEKSEIYTSLRKGLEIHFDLNNVSESLILEAVISTFGAKGSIIYSSNAPSGLGMLLSFQAIVTRNPEGLIAAFPAILRQVFINPDTNKFYGSKPFENCCFILAQAFHESCDEVGDPVSLCNAFTTFLASCHASEMTPAASLLNVLRLRKAVNAIGSSSKLCPISYEHSSAAFRTLLERTPEGASLESLRPLLAILTQTMGYAKAAKHSFASALKAIGSKNQVQSTIALDLAEEFVADIHAQNIWAESITQLPSESVALLHRLKTKSIPLNSVFTVKAGAKLRAAVDKGKSTEALEDVLKILQGVKTGERTISTTGFAKGAASSGAASGRQPTESFSRPKGDAGSQEGFGAKLFGFAFAVAVVGLSVFAARQK